MLSLDQFKAINETITGIALNQAKKRGGDCYVT